MGFGAERPLLFALGFVVLGPKRMHAMLGHVERAKAEFDKASRGIKSQLAATSRGAQHDGKNDHQNQDNQQLNDLLLLLFVL
jgi:Sec-independent protein translocase protein TatA